MKKKMTRKILAAIFAVSLAFGGGFLISQSVQPKAEIVLAEGEEAPEADPAPETPEETETETTGEEKPATSDDSSAPATSDQESSTSLIKRIIKALLKAFRDAMKDLINHIKSWVGKK